VRRKSGSVNSAFIRFDISPLILAGLNCFFPSTLTGPADILSRSRERGIPFEAEKEICVRPRLE
jgi:hypothetical protein